MKYLYLALLLVFFLAGPLQAASGTVDVESAHSVRATADRLEILLQKKGITIFNRIKHTEGGALVGVDLRQTELLIFGNPKIGAPLIRCQQSVALDLPQKALIWEDENGKVWITYNSAHYLKQRHAIRDCEQLIGRLENTLADITRAAAQ